MRWRPRLRLVGRAGEPVRAAGALQHRERLGLDLADALAGHADLVAWDENADPFTNAVRITVSGLRKRLGEPWLIATVAGGGYRIDTQPDAGREGGDRG